MKDAPVYDYEQLYNDRRLQFIYRPLKPSKFAVIFDPQKERESSTDRNQDTAQQVVVSQKLVFEELKKRIGSKGHKVLLVEDNQINQTVRLSPLLTPERALIYMQVILKFLARINVEVETVLDGAQCTETVFSKEPGYYSIILVSTKADQLSHLKLIFDAVRSPHAKQRRLPSLQGNSTMGEQTRIPSTPNHRTLGQRARRRLCQMRRVRLQLLCHETRRV